MECIGGMGWPMVAENRQICHLAAGRQFGWQCGSNGR
jgi:hypothetical protein